MLDAKFSLRDHSNSESCPKNAKEFKAKIKESSFAVTHFIASLDALHLHEASNNKPNHITLVSSIFLVF